MMDHPMDGSPDYSMRSVHPRATLAVLTALNFLNYIDRSVLFAVQPLIQREFGRSDAEMGFLTTAFFLCYMGTAPVLGYLADRYPRRPIIIAGALLWSAATLMTAITWDFRALLLRHTLVGLGEASFVAIAPGYIADLFPEHRRGRMLSVFFMGIPAGTALGFLIGGYLGYSFGWRAPFYVVAGPGILMALAMLVLREPARGAYDTGGHSAERGTLRGLARNSAYWTATLGMAFLTFAIGGLQVWMPTFLVRLRGLSLLHANLFFAVITAVNGVVATLAGGWVADRLLRRRPDAYYVVSGVTLAVSVPLTLVAIYIRGPAMFPAIFVAEFCLLFNTGPLNAAVVDSVGAGIRASAIAVNLLVIHLLGDSLSPTLIGYISDRFHSLQHGFAAAVFALVVASVILLYGKRYAPASSD
jgi:predicted MFS family arabinose efflux permease